MCARQWENQLDMFNFSALTIFTFVAVRDLIEFSHFFDADNSRQVIRHISLHSENANDSTRKKTRKKETTETKKTITWTKIYTQFLSTCKWNIKMVPLKQHAMYVNAFTFDEEKNHLNFLLYSSGLRISKKVRMPLLANQLEKHLSALSMCVRITVWNVKYMQNENKHQNEG